MTLNGRVSVVIPNWNGRKWLGPCLQSLRRQSYRNFKIIVVDNGSVDGSVSFLQTEFPEVQIVTLPVNVGFAAGMNAGIRVAQGTYIAALNNDTEVDADWLANMVAVMDAQPEFSVFACKIMDFTRRDIFDSLGDGYSRSGLSFKLAARCRDDGSFTEPFEVFGACAAACIYRKSMLDEVGLYDEDFFAYMEDVDLCIRARLAGYRCLAIPSAVVYHVGSATSGGSASAFSVRLTTRNVFAVILKNVPLAMLPRMLVTTSVVQMAAIMQAFTTDKRPWLRQHFRAYLAGLSEAFQSIPAVLSKRKKLAPLRRLSVADFSGALDKTKQMRADMERKLSSKS